MNKKKIINTTISDKVDAELILNKGENNGISKISIENQDNKYTFKMHAYSMIVGSDIIKSLDNIIDSVKNNIYENTYYSYMYLINYFLQVLLQEKMRNDEDLYKALDTWYMDDKDDEQDDEDIYIYDEDDELGDD